MTGFRKVSSRECAEIVPLASNSNTLTSVFSAALTSASVRAWLCASR
jgi:hypothetical protein